jgi:MSHA biogenesis protein MshP
MCHKIKQHNTPMPSQYDRRSQIHSPGKQQGSMLVISLFVIIVMALLGLTLSRLLSSSSDAIIYEVYGQRALHAARAGVEEQIALAFPISGSASCTASTIDFTPVPGLESCEVNAQCTQLNVVDGSISRTYYKFTSTGTCSAGDIIASRTVQVDAML